MAATTQVRLLVRTIVCDGLKVLSHACFPNKLSFDHLFTTQRTEHLARGKELELCTSPCPFLGLCTSSLRRGHANLLCIVPSFDKDPNRLCQSKLDSRSFDNIPLTGIWAQARKIKSRQKPAVPHTSIHQALRCLTSEVKKNAVQSMRGDIAFSKVTRKSQESSPTLPNTEKPKLKPKPSLL